MTARIPVRGVQKLVLDLKDIATLDSAGLRKYCHANLVTVIEVAIESLGWSGLVLCTPIDTLWGGAPLWLGHPRSRLMDWMRGQVESDTVYETFKRELKRRAISKDSLSRDIFTYQMYTGYGTGGAGGFGAKASALYHGWFRACTVPLAHKDKVVEYFEDFWRQASTEAIVSCPDAQVRNAGYYFLSPPPCDYRDARVLSWGQGSAGNPAAVRNKYFAEATSRLAELCQDPSQLDLLPAHVADPPMAFLSKASFFREDQQSVDVVNSLKAKLVRQLGWLTLARVVDQLQSDSDYPSQYRAQVAVPFGIEIELDNYMREARERCPLAFDEPDLEI